MNEFSPPGVLLSYLRAFLGNRVTRLREADDLGASAVELAVITGVLVLVAVGVLAIIVNFVKTQSNNISNTNVPNPANPAN